MINFFLVCIMGVYLFALDIEALQKEKNEYKQHNIIKHRKVLGRVNTDESRLIIIFKNKKMIDTDKKVLKEKYFLKLERCLVGTVCIFKIVKDRKIFYDLDKIKQELKNIEEIKYYRRYQFKPY